MKKQKILFLIHDLGAGGAEKVLVNLVNNIDRSKFDTSVIALFGGGVNEKLLKPDVHYHSVFTKTLPGNSHIMKALSPHLLHRKLIKRHYDIEIAYIEGPAIRIISGCADKDTKLLSWIHCTMKSDKEVCLGFRNLKEAVACYEKMDAMVFVSQEVQNAFLKHCPYSGICHVIYNTNETQKILEKSKELVDAMSTEKDAFRLIAVGKLVPVKGFSRLLKIHKKLLEAGYSVHTFILGEGFERNKLEYYICKNHLSTTVTLLGYQTNPYKYVSKCDLFICSSFSEGFSTATTESLIVGTPVCTVNVSGMKELLGENNEYGVVTDNTEEALYRGIKQLIDDRELLIHYRKQAAIRGKDFSTKKTVSVVEDMLMNL